MTDIRALTKAYVQAFNSRNLESVADYMVEEFALTDPKVFNLSPKLEVLNYIQELFENNEGLSFVTNRILVEGNASVIHFSLTLGETILDGVDLIIWKGTKMVKMYAYLTPRK